MVTVFCVTWLGVIAAQLAPGPNLLAVASVALAQGRHCALNVVLGVATGVALWAVAFALGLSMVFNAFPNAALCLHFFGGAYLLYISGRALYATWQGKPSMIRASSSRLNRRQAYLRGVTVVLTNPKAAMMWAAVSAFMLGSGLPKTTLLLFAPLASLSACVVYGGYGLLFSTQRARHVYLRLARPFEALFSGIFGVLGGKLIVDGIRQLKSS